MRFSFFPDFFERPERMRFAEQEADETIELAMRRHWVTNVPWILAALFIFALPGLIIFLDQYFGFNFLRGIPDKIYIGTLILWYMLVVAYVIEQFLHWYFNIYIVTNTHLVDINFISLLNRNINEARLEDIQNITSKVRGVIGSLFYFGDVHIQTAAETRVIDFISIPKPDVVADRIQDLQEGRE